MLIKRAFVTTLAAVSLMATSVWANPELYADEERQRAFIQAKIIEYFPEDFPTMLAIAYCETRSRPFVHWEADGSLRRHDQGIGTAAGTYQVLLGLHAPDINARSYNMHDIDDYMQFVRYLYERGSSRFSDWYESRPCWQHRVQEFQQRVAQRQ